MQHSLALGLVFTFSIVVVLGAPAIQKQGENPAETHHTRIFGNKNARITADGGAENDADEEEEELELENLKGHKAVSLSPAAAAAKDVTTTTSTQASVNQKRPENEEKPAISDNANSLKFPHHNPGGFDESLFAKKSGHNQAQGSPTADQNRLGRLLGDMSGSEHDRFNLQQTDYTPQDIAEYIFWTGDERGVAATIGDFLQEGFVSREDAVGFLEDVKRELNAIRARYTTSLAQVQPLLHEQQASPMLPNFNLDGYKGYTAGESQFYPKRDSTPQFPLPEIMNDAVPFRQPQALQLYPGRGGGLSGPNSNLMSVEELDYDEIADKLRTVDAKLREYALKDVIYQIGKNLFAESLKNSPGQSTQKFSEFIEAQSGSGRIPKDLEKDVLDVLVGAFVDAVDDRGVQQGELEHQLQEHRQNSAKQHVTNKLASSSVTPTGGIQGKIHGNV